MTHDDHTAHMRRALELARRGWGRVHPNPMVGAVVVREGRVVGEGWHAEYGGPHGEVEALRRQALTLAERLSNRGAARDSFSCSQRLSVPASQR